MRIGLISDTHIPGGAKEVPSQVVEAFQGVELILHAGNVCITPVLDWLERIAPVRAAGSADRDRWCYGDPRVAEQQVLEVEGQTIGVLHDLMVPGFGGYVYPGSLKNHFDYDSSRPLIPDQVFGKAVDIVVFGHTCTALVEEYGGTLLINPGSPTLRDQLMKIGTVAVLEVTRQGRQVEVIDLAKLR
ncbi:MAG: metallophosphoesterase family protein [Chloroflexi bacterium]|nr:metallophosphoesterase family protein [Chloroflexota bacterium]